MAAGPRFIKLHKKEPENYETTVEKFTHSAQSHVCQKANKDKHLTPTVEHGGGKLMIWTCFVAIKWTMNSRLHESNRPSV